MIKKDGELKIHRPGDVCRWAGEICKLVRLLLFFFPWRSNYSKWLRAVLSAHPGVCLLAPHPLPLQISSMLISNAILPVLHSPFFFFQSTPPCHRVSAAITFSEKSTPLEASYQNLLQQGGRLKLSGMTCGLDGAGGGDKCMANLWNIWIKGWGLWQGHAMWWHGKWEVLESTKAKCTIAWNHLNRRVKHV